MQFHRFVEACALLPMLYVPSARKNSVYCTGPLAELFATDCLRWRDVERVYVPETPLRLRDNRVTVGKPPVGSCSVVVVSPDENPEPYLFALAKDGVVNVCTRSVDLAAPMLKHLRSLFPRSVVPWREHTPDVLYGAMASPSGAPKRLRNPPGGARRLTAQYLPCLFTFGADETTLIFGAPAPKKPEPTPLAVGT